MSDYEQPAPEGKDPELWYLAQKRAGFKKHLTSYIIINAFLWAIWYFTGNHNNNIEISKWNSGNLPWPIWSSLGWGIGLAFHYAGAYLFTGANPVEREYEKLKNQQPKNS